MLVVVQAVCAHEASHGRSHWPGRDANCCGSAWVVTAHDIARVGAVTVVVAARLRPFGWVSGRVRARDGLAF
jgi:hypothetical protein